MRRLYVLTLCFLAFHAYGQQVVWPSPGMQIGQYFVNDWYQNYLNFSIYSTTPHSYCNRDWVYINYHLLREEQGRYYYADGCPNERILFDFNALPGDTIWNLKTGPYLVIDTFTHTLLTGVERRALRTKGLQIWQDTAVWVEGIGDLNYGFVPYSDFEGGSTHLICVRDSSGILYRNDDWPFDCDSFLCQLPKINFEVSCTNGILVTTNLSSGADSFFWEFGDGSTSTEFEPIHQYTSAGPFSVNLTLKTSCLPDTSITCGHEVICSTVGLVNPEITQEWNISPNPASDYIILQPPSENVAQPTINLTIFDLTGRKRLSATINLHDLKPVYICELPSGIYFLNIDNGQQVTNIQRFYVSKTK